MLVLFQKQSMLKLLKVSNGLFMQWLQMLYLFQLYKSLLYHLPPSSILQPYSLEQWETRQVITLE